MRRIAIINQKGGVGKTTTAANLAAALARAGQRVLVIDMDPQANLSLYLGAEPATGEPSSYSILCGGHSIQEALVATSTAGLTLVPAHIDLSGADLELAAQIGRETILRDALDEFDAQQEAAGEPYDFVLLDCPPSLGLLSINALTAAQEVMLVVQTEFFALQGLSKLVEIVQLIQKRMNPALEITTIVPCLYDSRLKLAREVLAELRRYFPGKVSEPVRTNVRLAESPSYALTIFDYAPESNGATDYAALGLHVLGVTADDVEPSNLKETAVALKEADREAPARRRRLVSDAEAAALDAEAGSVPAPDPVDEAPPLEVHVEAEAPPSRAARGVAKTTPAEEAEPIVEIKPRNASASNFGEGVEAELEMLKGNAPSGGAEPNRAAPPGSPAASADEVASKEEPPAKPEAASAPDEHEEVSRVEADSAEPEEAAPVTDSGRVDEAAIEPLPAPPRKAPLPVYGFGAYLGEDFDAFAHAQRQSGS
jgi:chromosome partitioning protein